MLDLKAQYATIRQEIKQVVDEVLESQYFILGPNVNKLEEEIASYSGTKHAGWRIIRNRCASHLSYGPRNKAW